MRFSIGSKLGVLLPAITILTVVSTCTVAFASPGTRSYAASTPSTTATYNGVPLKSNRAGASPTLPNGSTHPYRRQTGPQAIVDHVPGGKNTHAAIARSAAAVTAGAATLNATEGRLLQSFNGISNADQANANGGIQFAVTPPDQGLCVGQDPS